MRLKLAHDPYRQIIEAAVAEADALLRKRLTEAGIKAPHVVMAITPRNASVIRAIAAPPC